LANAQTSDQTPCYHHECYMGVPLDPDCSPCVADVCSKSAELNKNCCGDGEAGHWQEIYKTRGPGEDEPWWDGTCIGATLGSVYCTDCGSILNQTQRVGKVASRGIVTTEVDTDSDTDTEPDTDDEPHRIWCEYNRGTEDLVACDKDPDCGWGTCDEVCIEGVSCPAGDLKVLSCEQYYRQCHPEVDPVTIEATCSTAYKTYFVSVQPDENKTCVLIPIPTRDPDGKPGEADGSHNFIAYKTAFFDVHHDSRETTDLTAIYVSLGAGVDVGNWSEDWKRWMTSQWGLSIFSRLNMRYMGRVFAPIEGALVYAYTYGGGSFGSVAYNRSLWNGIYQINFGQNTMTYISPTLSAMTSNVMAGYDIWQQQNLCAYAPSIPMYVQIAYDDFNPRGKPRYYVIPSQESDCVTTTQVKGTNFPVDVFMISGVGCLTNRLIREGQQEQPAITCERDLDVTDLAELEADTDSDTSTPTGVEALRGRFVEVVNYNMDAQVFMDGGSIVDWSGGIEQTVFDHEADEEGHKGLVTQIRAIDLMDTTIYIFREGTGELLASRSYLRPGEVSFGFFDYDEGRTFDEYVSDAQQYGDADVVDLARFRYTSIVRGMHLNLRKGTLGSYYPGKDLEMEEAPGVGYTRGLRRGEKAKVVLVNRATGYIGTKSVVAGSEQNVLSIDVGDVVMGPPNLKVEVERIPDSEFVDFECSGCDFGGDNENAYKIGYEGKALTNDECIAVTTTWLDENGQALPEQLPGYTGRLAFTEDATSITDDEHDLLTNSDAVHFPVEPNGPHLKVFWTNMQDKRRHYYLHLNGRSIIDPFNFARKGDELDGAGEGQLQSRPGRLVPFKVR